MCIFCGLVLRLNQKHVRIKNLSLKNIGPFLEAELDFMGANEAGKHAPVTIITGENGTGKTVVLDAIRVKYREQINKHLFALCI
jgi:predicted ATP-binding protein involved in virulence